jgi:ankyrin repeat protein
MEYLNKYKKYLDKIIKNQYGGSNIYDAVRIGNLNKLEDFVNIYKQTILKDHSYRDNLKTFINKPDYNNNTLLHYASEVGNTNIIKYLLYLGANNTLKDTHDNIPINLAILNKHYNAVNILLCEHIQNKTDNLEVKNTRGYTPLHISCFPNNNNQIIELLLKNKSNRYCVDLLGNTPLHYCAQYNNVNNITPLIDFSTDSHVNELIKSNKFDEIKLYIQEKIKLLLSIKNNENKTPFDLAKENNNQTVVDILNKL